MPEVPDWLVIIICAFNFLQAIVRVSQLLLGIGNDDDNILFAFLFIVVGSVMWGLRV